MVSIGKAPMYPPTGNIFGGIILNNDNGYMILDENSNIICDNNSTKTHSFKGTPSSKRKDFSYQATSQESVQNNNLSPL